MVCTANFEIFSALNSSHFSSDLINLKENGLMLEADNDGIDEEDEDRDFMRNIPGSNDDIINALNIEDEESDAPLKSGFHVPNFDPLREKMEDIYGEKKVRKTKRFIVINYIQLVDFQFQLLKLVRKKGVGDPIPENCQVSVKYLGFFEFQDEPFDSTFAHDHCVMNVRMNNGNLLPGLEIGIATMVKFETAIFLIHPDLAYGVMGCPPRIPPNSEVMFVVTLIDYSDNVLLEAQEELSRDQMRSFAYMMPRIKNVLTSARDTFKKKQIRQAIRE